MRQQDHYTYEYTNIEQEIKMLVMVSILFIFGKIYLPVESYYKRIKNG